ncbi:TPA: type I toxin-antitoxin system Ibs family toxin [Escherichia coli]|uniref:Type I toxin-antitoxin system Ibs family toxin n=1 Tax=Escherichia coli TaxID=562 RepID=A0A2J1C9W7_ECOLX|nr:MULTISPECIES: type I toxin-antitoxin system Ibs family toxin [Escherichia]EHQ5525911.1 type I toxin-antitoxin system Ibs family toxin [Escherichia coli O2]EFH7122775.1 type I toxin-antitoxin system Ibs family toxin [Escherichia coli]EFI4023352.1 type I toxin-antitoxin system Ibs family toxin [Escherichia coli]EFL4479521.1 type I toxin-antitoxin system Ibs family toxin [Escherichia fergusonii]EFM2061713.1 type I toxin-antitoxin system Ibs family toxin [Escherichia coli]
MMKILIIVVLLVISLPAY